MDEFKNLQKGLTSPASVHFVVVPNDAADLPILPRAIYCETGGTLAVRDAKGTDLTYTMSGGDRLELRAVRVLATGTTGTYYGWS